jgi:anthranilate phosphoribosyltransferase
MDTGAMETSLHEIGFCFLMAQNHHAAMRHVMPARRALGRRTIFNLLGPLSNPANAKKQLLGVWDAQWVRPIADSLLGLGTECAWVVNGAGGIDEISLEGETHVAMLNHGIVTELTLSPDDFGLPHTPIADIIGGSVMTNATALLSLLDGHKSAYRNYVLANAAAVLNIAGITKDLKEGVEMAASSIDTGRALSVLNDYKERGKQ